jgi:hypothetical protein
MKKKLLVMGVVVIALLGFSGIASSSVYMQYWDKMNTKGWIDYGMLGNYHVMGRYNYNDHMVWKEFDGEIYTPTHENWHYSYDIKCLDGNKPITITKYNFMYQLKSTPTQYKMFYMGFFHLKDPQASNLGLNGGEQAWFRYCNRPAVTKIKYPHGPPIGGKYPTIDDTAKLTDWIFENFDYTLIPLIDRIELFDIKGSVLTIDVSLLN